MKEISAWDLKYNNKGPGGGAEWCGTSHRHSTLGSVPSIAMNEDKYMN